MFDTDTIRAMNSAATKKAVEERDRKKKPPKLPENTVFKLNFISVVKLIIAIKRFIRKQKHVSKKETPSIH